MSRTHRSRGRSSVCCIIPPYILEHLEEHGDDQQREAARATLEADRLLRRRRVTIARIIAQPGVDARMLGLVPQATGSANRVFDAHQLPMNSFLLPGTLRRGPDDGPVGDTQIDQAWDGAHATIDFYGAELGRDGIDANGMDVISSVRVTDPAGQPWDNAAWNGQQMVYGEGRRIFKHDALTSAIDVIGHELTHGVTQYTAGLEYEGQSGALNESMSDVFGSMVKQRVNGETAADADWLIGDGLLVVPGALRSMKAPGTAYQGDPQPATMSDYKDLPNTEQGDNGGVHINSGIPNRAFYLAATALGGKSWERAGKVWYQALTQKLQSDADFKAAAQATIEAAEELFSGDAAVRSAVENAWKTVEVL